MKIRTDFITNSSSSSFVIFGTYLNNLLSEEGLEKFEQLEDKWDYIEGKTEKTNLVYSFVYGETSADNCGVGMGIEELIKAFPDTKLSDIRKTVADEINRTFGTKLMEKDIIYIEECWMDN